MPAPRAVALLSGGLDSALAVRLVQREGVEVVGLHLSAPTACRADARAVADDLGIALEVRAKGEEFLRLLRAPRHGYGRHMNPCLDCRAFMFRRADAYLRELGGDFLVTGEVLGQRPMSQTRAAIERIERDSGLERRVLRPLSARLLPPTLAEARGWVRREAMLAISGRGRHEQLALAERLGVRRFESPGGGCLLTDAAFSARLRDYFGHVGAPDMRLDDVELLAIGRHVRVADDLKLVVGRREAENRRLAAFVSAERWLLEPADFRGPSVLVCGGRSAAALAHAAEQLLAHAEAPPGARARVVTAAGEETLRLADCLPIPVAPAAGA
ncbi:MAG TPA: hypothetical protein VGU27_09355 [Candidatus Eisenbacteria bacterium]|nr:hypothetical protein [Candidatus Eisenbacteria bacterium]